MQARGSDFALELMKQRRTVRQYTDQAVSDEQVRVLLEAAMAAPSGSNLQPWRFAVVRRQDLRQALSEIQPWAYMAAKAPVVIAVCSDQTVSPRHWLEDAAIATENILLQATAMGLGACWIACYPDEDRQSKARQILNVPEALGILCLVAVGYPASTPPPRTQYDESKVWYEQFR